MTEEYQHFIAGWLAGICGVLVGHPMDTVKTFQQMSYRRLRTTDTVTAILNKDGVKGFYKGMLFPFLSAGSLNSVFFGVCQASLDSLRKRHGYHKMYPRDDGWLRDLFMAGSIAGAASSVITCPSELIKIKMQLGKAQASSYLTFMDLHKRYGIRGFYVGFVPTFFRDTLGGGLYISAYQFTRHNLYGKLNISPGVTETLVAGGVAGLASWIPVVPFDTIKSRIQGDNFENSRYKGMIDCGVDLYKHSGFRGFFKGCFMIIVRSIPVNVAILYGYELVLLVCEKVNTDG